MQKRKQDCDEYKKIIKIEYIYILWLQVNSALDKLATYQLATG